MYFVFTVGSRDYVGEAMVLAAQRWGGPDQLKNLTFNSANFARAMVTITGIQQTLDGGMVAAILESRSDVLRIGVSHWQIAKAPSFCGVSLWEKLLEERVE